MKSLLLATALLTLLSETASAQLFQKHYYYLNTKTGEMISLIKINQAEGTGVYYDYLDYTKKTVPLDVLAKETDGALGEVEQGEMLLAKFEDGLRPCAVYHLFENGTARVGCQNGDIADNIGVDRLVVAQYNAQVDQAIPEIAEAEGFATKEKVILRRDAANMKSGVTVRIEAIFANGDALIQKAGANLLDTSGVLLKRSNVAVVNLTDLEKK